MMVSLQVLGLTLSMVVLSFAENRDKRVFSMFSIVNFKNDQCTTTGGLTGVCMTDGECTDAGGTSESNCAAGFGKCCIVRYNTCDSTVRRNCSYIENPGYPSGYTTATTCKFTIERCQDDICQIRLDFTNTQLLQPSGTTTTSGNCVNTILTTDAGAAGDSIAINSPPLCGTLTGQHIYLDSGRASTASTLTFTKATTGSDVWRIKVTQIECWNPTRAPPGCLQYFYGANRHTVTSFNWDGTKTCSTGCLLSDTYYRVCFRPEKGMCGSGYSQTSVTSGDSWDLNENEDEASATEEGEVEVGNTDCTESYVQIASVVDTTEDRFCSSGVLGTVTATTAAGVVYSRQSQPWEFTVASVEDLEQAQGGFSIEHQQLVCNGHAALGA